MAKKPQACKIEDCKKLAINDCYCPMHRSRLKRTGNLQTTKNEAHGRSFTTEYRSWSNMRSRCYNPNSINYHIYGGRGIRVCNEWLHSFNNFLHDMGTKPDISYSIDRINVNGNYTPKNCKWSSDIEQANNKRSCHLLTYNGKTQNVTQWAQELDINRRTLFARIRYGWEIDRILSTR